MPDKQLEILSPAGNLATMKSAINNGADAVYLGGKSFSARKNAVNFSDEEIIEAVEYAHLYGSKVFVTVNTVISDNELAEVYTFVKFLYEAGVDALIIQDLGVLKMVRECFPDFEIHASTQMTIHNLDGARLAKELGFKRVVLSRELTFSEIKNISENVDIELEVFVHGALCMSYSGQCLMSSFLGGRSGNRGACAQPCRLPYTLLDSGKKPVSPKDKYLLSLKDLCLIDEMKTLRECGVTSLKIEGRMKSIEYVSLVTDIYNRYRSGGKVSETDYKALETIFSRSGFTKGYLEGKTGRHMLNFDKSNDDVYQGISHEVHMRAEELSLKEADKIPFDALAEISLGEPMVLTVTSSGKTVTVKGSVPAEKALNVSLDADRVTGQISRTGSTPFELANIQTRIDDGVSLPIKEINEIRRQALAELTGKLSSVHRSGEVYPFEKITTSPNTRSTPRYVAEIRNIFQAETALGCGYDKIIVPYSLYCENKDFFNAIKEKVALLLPPIMRDLRSVDTNIDCNDVYVSNLSQFKTFSGKNLTADFRLNAFNSFSVAKLGEMGAGGVCLSPELNIRQIAAIKSTLPKELIVYGRVPVMTVQNCLVKSSNGKCACGDEYYLLKDRKGVCFPVFADKLTCTNIIYNSTPIYMGDRIDELPQDLCAMRFIFTIESPEEIKNIYFSYKNKQKSDDDFTRGHYYRGV